MSAGSVTVKLTASGAAPDDGTARRSVTGLSAALTTMAIVSAATRPSAGVAGGGSAVVSLVTGTSAMKPPSWIAAGAPLTATPTSVVGATSIPRTSCAPAATV